MGLAGVGIAATVASTAVGFGTSLAKSGAVSGGQSQANAAQTGALAGAENQLGPWTTSGLPANKQQSDLLGLNGQPAADAAMSTFQSNPGYRYQVQQGLRAVDAGAAANDMLRSGATLKAEQTLGSNLADQDFGNYWNRLQQLSSGGLTAAGELATGQIKTGQDIAGTDASAAAGQSSIYGGLGTGVSTGINQLANNTAFQKWLNPATPAASNYNPGYSPTPSLSPGYGDTLFQSGGVF